MKFSEQLKGITAGVRCTYTEAYTTPEIIKKNKVRSYSAKALKSAFEKYRNQPEKYFFEKRQYNVSDFKGLQENSIGTLTGNYQYNSDTLWIEITPLYCNRANTVWVRGSTITPQIEKNEGGTKAAESNPGEAAKKSSDLLKYLTLGFMVYEAVN